MEASNKIIDPAPGCEIVTSRIINVSRALVYKAWTNPVHLKKWWGPNGFTNTFHEFDLREGGKWSFIMHGPDKRNYPNESTFLKIIENEFFVFNHISPPKFQVHAIFKEITADKTGLIFKMVFNTEEECTKLRAFVTDKNEENMDRLEAELLSMSL